nr:MAG TPA: hypothetical protein [Caudoviricetes sp.]
MVRCVPLKLFPVQFAGFPTCCMALQGTLQC